MNPTPALPLAKYSVLATTDPDHACAHLSPLFRPHRIALRGTAQGFGFEHHRAEYGGLVLNALRYGSAVTVHAPTRADSYLVTFTLRGCAQVAQGRQEYATTPQTVCVLNPTRALTDRMADDYEMLIVQIDGARLRAALASEFGITVHQPLEFMPAALPLQGAIGSIANLVRTLCADLDGECAGLDRPHVAAPVVAALTSLMLSELPHNYAALVSRPRTTSSRSVRAVEAYVEAHLGAAIGLDDLMAAAGMSARALQCAFQRVHGTTPMRWLRDRRLDWARQLLLGSPDAPVTEIALACGFTHFGRFAQAYRMRFGTPPSHRREPPSTTAAALARTAARDRVAPDRASPGTRGRR